MAKKPSYRKVKKYYKSPKQYWVERNRRKRVRELADAGLSQRQIAEKLNVSERKVKRDVAKIRPYQERKFRHQLRLLRKEWDEQFEAELAGETPLQQLEILGRKIIQYDKALRMREYYHHQIYINIDLDRIVYGLPEVRMWPKEITKTKFPLTINLRYIKNQKAISIGSITAGSH